jgi:preprotein translocase subunit YajC
MISNSYAQETTTAPPSGQTAQQQPNAFVQFFPFVVIFFIFYFLVIRPQKRKVQQEQKFLTELKKGDEVFTKAGVLGSITGLTDKLVTLEVSEGVKIKVLRSQVGGLAKTFLQAPEKKTK